MTTVKRVKGAGYSELQFALENLEGGEVGKVGWFENSKYDDKNKTPVAYVAAIHEFGFMPKNIPPRPFFRPTILKRTRDWRLLANRLSNDIFHKRKTLYDALDLLTQKAAGDVRKTISLIETPALKPATIAARIRARKNKKHLGRLDKPLIDTGIMIGTLIGKVETE